MTLLSRVFVFTYYQSVYLLNVHSFQSTLLDVEDEINMNYITSKKNYRIVGHPSIDVKNNTVHQTTVY